MRKTELKKSSYRSAKKGGKKGYPSKQNFAQLTEKIDKLEKALKKSAKNIRNPRMFNPNHSIITINCCKLIATV